MNTQTLLLAPTLLLAAGFMAPDPQGSATQLPGTNLQTEITLRSDTPWLQLPPAGLHPPPTLYPPAHRELPNAGPHSPPVLNHPEGEASIYCTSTFNSTGLRARMSCAGSLSVCQNDTCLVVDLVPQGSIGLFFYGGKAAQIPMANGYLCVSPFHPGLFRLPSVAANVNMRAELLIDFETLPAAGAVVPGSTWYFQYWFRDPMAGGASSNFSDGLRITFCN